MLSVLPDRVAVTLPLPTLFLTVELSNATGSSGVENCRSAAKAADDNRVIKIAAICSFTGCSVLFLVREAEDIDGVAVQRTNNFSRQNESGLLLRAAAAHAGHHGNILFAVHGEGSDMAFHRGA